MSSFLTGTAASLPAVAVGILAFETANGFVGATGQDILVAAVELVQSAAVLAVWVSVMRLGCASRSMCRLAIGYLGQRRRWPACNERCRRSGAMVSVNGVVALLGGEELVS